MPTKDARFAIFSEDVASLEATLSAHLGHAVGCLLSPEITGHPSAERHLKTRVLNRIRGAFALVAQDAEALVRVARAVRRIRIEAVQANEATHVHMEASELVLGVDLGAGPSGSFTETEIREVLERATRPESGDARWQPYREERFEAFRHSVRELLDEHIDLRIAWEELPWTEEGERVLDERLLYFLHDLRYIASVPDAQWLLGRELRGIFWRPAVDPSQRSCSITEDRQLEIVAGLTDEAVRGPTKSELETALNRDLRLGVRRHLSYLESVSRANLEGELAEALSAPVRVVFELPHAGVEESTTGIRRLREQCECFSHWSRSLADASLRSLFQARVRELRCELVLRDEDRELLGDRGALICRIGPGSNGLFGSVDLTERVPGVLAGMEPVSEAPRARQPTQEERSETDLILARYRERELPRRVASIQRILDREIPITIDWESFGGDPRPAMFLARSGLPAIEDALGQLLPRQSEDSPGGLETLMLEISPGLPRTPKDLDPLIEQLVQSGISAIKVTHAPRERSAVALTEGLLDVRLDFNAGGIWARTIRETLETHLGLGVAKEQRRLQAEALPEFVADVRKALHHDLIVEIDWPSFVQSSEPAWNDQALHRLETDVLRNLDYAIRQCASELESTWQEVRHLRIQHVPLARARELRWDGQGMVFKVHLHPYPTWDVHREDSGWQRIDRTEPGLPENFRTDFGVYELEALLPLWLRALSFVREHARPEIFLEAAIDSRALEECARVVSAVFPFEVSVTFQLPSAPSSADVANRALMPLVAAFLNLLEDPAFAAFAPDTLRHIKVLAAPSLEGLSDPHLASGTLTLVVSYDCGAGGIDPVELIRSVRDELRLDAAPHALTLRERAIPWAESRLAERFDAVITFDIDWASFHEGSSASELSWAFSNLDERCIRGFWYALSSAAEKKPKLEALVSQRLSRVRIEHVATPDAKELLARGNDLILRAYLLKGYEGYLTLDELKRALPGALARLEGDLDRKPLSEAAADTELDEFVRERLPQLVESLREATRADTEIDIDFASLPRYSGIARGLERDVIDPLDQAFQDLARDRDLSQVFDRVEISREAGLEEPDLRMTDRTLRIVIDFGPDATMDFESEHVESFVQRLPEYCAADDPDLIYGGLDFEEVASQVEAQGVPQFRQLFGTQLGMTLEITVDVDSFRHPTKPKAHGPLLLAAWQFALPALWSGLAQAFAEPRVGGRVKDLLTAIRIRHDPAGSRIHVDDEGCLWLQGDFRDQETVPTDADVLQCAKTLGA